MKYLVLPDKPLGKDVNTYSIVVKAPDDLRSIFSSTQIEDLIGIGGLKRLPPDESQMHVEITLENLIVNKWKVEERVQILKDDAGKETGRKSFYYVYLSYVCPGRVVIKNYQEEVVSENTFGAVEWWSSSEFPTSKEASDFYVDNEAKI